MDKIKINRVQYCGLIGVLKSIDTRLELLLIELCNNNHRQKKLKRGKTKDEYKKW